MSKDAAILARAILPLVGTCRMCGCHGDSCSLAAGERCVWMNALRTLCSNPRCVRAVASQEKNRRREEQRKEKRAAMALPMWMRLRKQGQKPKKRRVRKVKGRAA